MPIALRQWQNWPPKPRSSTWAAGYFGFVSLESIDDGFPRGKFCLP